MDGLQMQLFCASGAHVPNVRSAPVLEKLYFRHTSTDYDYVK